MAVDATNIRDLKQLIRDHVCSCFDIIDLQMSALTAPGENYGSIMQRVDIRVKNPENGKEKTVYAVAKLVPAQPYIREIFNTQVTFKNELGFYSTIVPTFEEFQKENGMEGLKCFGKMLGGRINLNGSDVVDGDAVIMLENLKMTGYTTADRRKGFDLPLTKLVLKDLAEFHAVSLALKIRKPEVFKEKILPYCKLFRPPMEEMNVYTELLVSILSEYDDCRALVSKLQPWGTKQDIRKPREPFATLIHQDMWVNNMMQKYEDGIPVSNKFVDFQMIDYGSPMDDLFFMLFSSVQVSVLREHIDSLLRFYHERFIEVLGELKCDTEPFNFDNFMEELRLETEYDFPHAIIFSTFIVNLGKISQQYHGGPIDKEKILRRVDQENRERARFIAVECAKRGWLH